MERCREEDNEVSFLFLIDKAREYGQGIYVIMCIQEHPIECWHVSLWSLGCKYQIQLREKRRVDWMKLFFYCHFLYVTTMVNYEY